MERLSNDFLIASEVRLHNLRGDRIWFNKMVEMFDGQISRCTISKNIDKLLDFGIIIGDWEKGTSGCWIRVFKVSAEAESLIDNIIEKYGLGDQFI